MTHRTYPHDSAERGKGHFLVHTFPSRHRQFCLGARILTETAVEAKPCGFLTGSEQAQDSDQDTHSTEGYGTEPSQSIHCLLYVPASTLVSFGVPYVCVL